MKFTLEIELGNDEMRTWGNIVAALRGLISKLNTHDEYTGRPKIDEGRIRDINGNTVGKWEIVPDAPTDRFLPADSTMGAHERTERAKMLQARKTTHDYSDVDGNGFCFECGLEADHAEANHTPTEAQPEPHSDNQIKIAAPRAILATPETRVGWDRDKDAAAPENR